MTLQPTEKVWKFKPDKSLSEAITKTVFNDEPCYYLGEFNLQHEGKTGRVRFQVLRVVRNDRLVTAYVPLGPARDFTANQFQTWGGQVVDGRGTAWHTVAELRDIADELRGQKPLQIESTDLQSAFRNHAEEKKNWSDRKSTFGRKGSLVRA